MNNLTDVWGKTMKYFQENQPDDYSLWIMHLNFFSFEKKKNRLLLSVSNPIVQDRIYHQYRKKIAEVFADLSGIADIQVEIILSGEPNIFEEGALVVEKDRNQKPFQPRDVKLVSHQNYTVDLNSRFTFERLVVGTNNKLAYAAAVQISQNPGKSYNPFFIYGGVGLGKTHLMQAIGNFILQHQSELKVIYVTVENYVNDYVIAIKNKKLESFRAKYRGTDVLLLDDIQFLEEKVGFQEELFHTFNKLYQSNKQIVFTCDKPPKELKKIQERLINRLNWGLTLDIKHPDLETRKAIILKKLEEIQLLEFLDNKTIDFLSENITTNVRDIESAVLKIKSLIQLANEKISIELLENHLSDILTPIRAQQKKITCETIQMEVANHYGISYLDMKSNKRTKDVSFPRQMAMYVSKNLLKLSFAEIGNEFGGRDHSTVLASCKKVEGEIRRNPSIRNDYEELLKIFSNF